MSSHRVFGLIAIAALVAAPGPVRAAPDRAEIVSVHRLDACSSSVCTDGDPSLKANAIVAGTIQVHFRAHATLGLDWARLDVRYAQDPRWYCLLHRYGGGEFDIVAHVDWDTARWPPENQQCAGSVIPHLHDDPTPNDTYEFRVVAQELPTGERTEGDAFPLRLSNPAVAPSWASAPTVAGEKERKPRVTLRWKLNPEDPALGEQKDAAARGDIVEYHFVRANPDGSESEFAVGTADPSAQGCSRAGTTFYQCVDDSFSSSGFAGRYRYAVIAYRPGANGPVKCSLRKIRCLESPLSSVHSVTVSEPGGAQPPSVDIASPDASESAEPAASPTGSPPPDAPVAVIPPTDRSEQLSAAPDEGEDSNGPLLPLAVALVVVAGGWHARRWLPRR